MSRHRVPSLVPESCTLARAGACIASAASILGWPSCPVAHRASAQVPASRSGGRPGASPPGPMPPPGGVPRRKRRQGRGAAHPGRARHRPGDQEDRQAPIGRGRRWSKTSTCSTRRSRSRDAISRPQVPRLPPAHRLRASRYQRHHPPGLRRRNALGLPGCPRYTAVLPQAQHQADPGTAQLARARSQDQGTGHHPDGPRRPGDPARRACARDFQFDQKEEGELDGKKVWIFHGTWKTRQGLIGPTAAPCSRSGFLPPYIPMDATLYLGKDDGWPYKLSPRRADSRRSCSTPARWAPTADPSARRARSKRSTPTQDHADYSDVKLNATIRLDEFAFQAPATATVEDNTEMIVKGLDQAIQCRSRARKPRPPRRKARCSTRRSTSPRRRNARYAPVVIGHTSASDVRAGLDPDRDPHANCLGDPATDRRKLDDSNDR